MSKFSDFIRKNQLFVIIMVILALLSAYTVIFTPRGFEMPELETMYVLFGPSLSALLLLIGIGGYLVYRYIVKEPPRSDSLYQFIWGASFLVYSLTFLGLCLQALGFDFANMNEPFYFLIWRSPMIIWVAGMWIGTIKLFTERRLYIYTPALIIFLVGEGWFILRLVILQDLDAAIAIEQTMYGFLFGEFIPMAVVIAYLFYTYGRDLGLSSAKLLTLGFSLLALTYAAWAPWHFSGLTYIYFIWFDLFLVALALIFAGFFALPKETTTKAV